jgi:hypothetical protein
MKKPKWEDTSSYSRGERGTVDPSAWTLSISGLDITVHRYIHSKGIWFGTCYQMNVERITLESDEIIEAQCEFVHMLQQRAMTWHHALTGIDVLS